MSQHTQLLYRKTNILSMELKHVLFTCNFGNPSAILHGTKQKKEISNFEF